MNRRNFLKRIAAVAAGAVVVSVTYKFKPNPAQRSKILYGSVPPHYRWRYHYMNKPYGFDPPDQPSFYPKHKLGTRYQAPDGSIYVYLKNTTKTDMPFNCYSSEG